MALDSIYGSGKTLEQRAKENNRAVDVQYFKEHEANEIPYNSLGLQNFDDEEMNKEVAQMMAEYEEIVRRRTAKGNQLFAELEATVEKSDDPIERTSQPSKLESKYSKKALEAAEASPAITQARKELDELMEMLKATLDKDEDANIITK